jgi:hypothetical protein
VVDVRARHTRDVGGDPGHPGQLVVPGLVDRLRREREGRRGQVEEPRRICVGQSALGDGPVGQLEQLRREQRARGEEPLHPLLQVWAEEPPVLGDQHGGEDPERVAGQLGGVDRPERRGHHGERCRLGVAQVVAADRVHAHRGEDPADLLELGRATDPDRAVPLRGDPVDAAEPLGRTTLALEDLGVHLVGHLDERGVRRHLTPVHVGQPAGEGSPQVGRGRRRHGRSIS